MIWWHLIFSDNKKSVGYAWNLMGFVAKLAQGVGAIPSSYALILLILISVAHSLDFVRDCARLILCFRLTTLKIVIALG